jgi:ERCC4-type nuclease
VFNNHKNIQYTYLIKYVFKNTTYNLLGMKLYVDCREKKLYPLLTAFNFSNQSEYIDTSELNTQNTQNYNIKKRTHQSDCLKIESKQLELGDLILCNDDDEILLLFERKSVNDLASSIQDGRYREQSSRLINFNIENHNIIYIIEGNIERPNVKSHINGDTLKACVVSLNLSKGFSTLKTNNIDDSAKWILAYCYKVGREKELQDKLINKIVVTINDTTKNTTKNTTNEINSKHSNNNDVDNNNYTIDMCTDTNNTCILENGNSSETELLTSTEENIMSTSSSTSSSITTTHLEHLSKQAKTKYITKDNIQILMLSLIPYVSVAIAEAIIKEHKNINTLINNLNDNENCLDNILIKTNKGTRKIGKNVIKKIKEYLRCK